MTPVRLLRTLALAAAVPAAAGCQSQWYEVSSEEDRVATTVFVRTTPPGGAVYLDGKRMDLAPVRIPIAYDHKVTLWERQTNSGATIRDSTGLIGTILLFPIWIPASFFQKREERFRHEYASNVHRISAQFTDDTEAEQQVTLEGQAEVTVDLVAGARPR